MFDVTKVGPFMSAATVDCAQDDNVRVTGAATALQERGALAACLDNTGEGFWFFEILPPFASSDTFDDACSLILSLACVASPNGFERTPMTKGVSTAVVLTTEQGCLYLTLAKVPVASRSEPAQWTTHILPLDTSVPWRVSGPPIIVDGVARFLTDTTSDSLASLDDIRQVLTELQSIRIRGGHPASSDVVMIRQVTVMRVAETSDR